MPAEIRVDIPPRGASAKYNFEDKKVKNAVSAGAAKAAKGATTSWLRLASTWDAGNRTVRVKILKEFIKNNKNKTGPQLEHEFSNGASLFLTRLTAWLRLTYLFGYELSLQFEAISIFVSASSGQRFLIEFLEIGGVLTLLEILGLDEVKDCDKAGALKLLLDITMAGRKFKEFVCDCYGVRAVADCMAKSEDEVTQDCARNLLYHLGVGNPKFMGQVVKAVLSILNSNTVKPTPQQMSGQVLRMLLPHIPSPSISIVEAALNLLRNIYIQVQYEGYEILKGLIYRSALQPQLISRLIEILRTPMVDSQDHDDRRRRKTIDATNMPMGVENRRGSVMQPNAPGESRRGSVMPQSGPDTRRGSVVPSSSLNSDLRRGSVMGDGRSGSISGRLDLSKKQMEFIASVYVQQAYSAKLLGVIAASSVESAERMIEEQVVSALLITISNVNHPDSQRYASNTLLFLAENFSHVKKTLLESLGESFWTTFQSKPDTFYKDLTPDQVKYLQRNHIRVHQDATRPDKMDEEDSFDPFASMKEEKLERLPTFQAKKELEEVNEANEEEEAKDAVVPLEGPPGLIGKMNAEEEKHALEIIKRREEYGDIKSMYNPMAVVSINSLYATNKSVGDSQVDIDDKFKKELDAMKLINSRRTKAVEKKSEMQVILDPKQSDRVNHALSKDLFTVNTELKTQVEIAVNMERAAVEKAIAEQNEEGNY